MLSHLHISNYALISELDVDFAPGFTTVTGETGAGKSILLGALGLLLGGRASANKAADPGAKIVAEGVFTGWEASVGALLTEMDLETDGEELILRREVSPSGRSRAFINDTPVSLSALTQVGARLADIHSQNQNAAIARAAYQLRVLDAMAANQAEREAYAALYGKYVALRLRIKETKERVARGREKREFLAFRLSQLHALKLRAGEQAELEKRQEILADSASLTESISSALSALGSGEGAEGSIIPRLGDVLSDLGGVNLALFSAEKPTLAERVESARLELADVAETLSDYLERVDSDPAMLEKIDVRLTALYEAQKQFNAPDEAALLVRQADLEQEYASLQADDDTLPALEAEAKALAPRLKEAAERLTETRRSAAESFSARLLEMARPLGLPNLRFEARLNPVRLTREGADEPQFLVAFNKNQPLQPVGDVASGGETSRLMLCLKAIVATHVMQPTLIFDEVDTGVSGDIAARMASLMCELAERVQVLAITHLPQVAAAGSSQLLVYKQDTDQATRTSLRPLRGEERVAEIARMLSGATLTEAALANARTLLSPE